MEKAITDQTRAVFVEIITNPQLQVPDVEAISRITRARGVPLIVDGTTTSLGLFTSKSFGADIEVISSTKSISGGATSVGGLIVDNGLFDWSKNPKTRLWAEKAGPMAFLVYLRREVYRNMGACLSPHNAYLQMLGLETLELRLRKSCGKRPGTGTADRETPADQILSLSRPEEFPVLRGRPKAISERLRRAFMF